ncbi:glycerol kinase [Pasteurella multocida subsp. multocida str. Anand1_cattle]|nr:glycerol kinase [Pasteurella multocida subsp. multocida str. Anand1_cattle]
MQFQADILATKVERPKVKEVTALGAAYLAGLATGFWKDLSELRDKASIEKTFVPDGDEAKRTRRYKGWKKAVKRAARMGKRGRVVRLNREKVSVVYFNKIRPHFVYMGY